MEVVRLLVTNISFDAAETWKYPQVSVRISCGVTQTAVDLLPALLACHNTTTTVTYTP